jgi:hypothetical protein
MATRDTVDTMDSKGTTDIGNTTDTKDTVDNWGSTDTRNTTDH